MSDPRIIAQRAAPLRQQVVEILRQDILDNIMHPGERLLESTLCERYGVSRTVIREALRQLESESLITMLPNRGPIVTILSARDIESLYEVRASLEGLAGELFARNATADHVGELIEHLALMETTYLAGDLHTRGESKDKFYRILLRGGGNEVLSASLKGIHTRIGIFRHYAFLDKERVNVSMKELRGIVQSAAVDRDPDGARQRCEEHIRLAGALAVLEYRARIDLSLGTALLS
ncbi:GntR family transcriptional regulator [Cryobacterium glaciale]|uniref:GntR family transcriptional regulator n=1 Tax=Cryobacterium glaciale TaxID=1259145 RepID=A0A4R8V5Q6_9MICO|nr:GntR family transcriptional regulator [Cryobacterium glaciale]TFB76477.1 GntR family transcriptional regulator [Cryobacterium glaciale]